MAGYRPFATVRLAIVDRVWHKQFYIEVDERVWPDGTVSYNLDAQPDDLSDLNQRDRWSDIKQKDLPANGRILVSIYSRKTDDYMNDYVLTLQGKQVVAIDGVPWQAPPPAPRIKPLRNEEAETLVHATVKSLLASLRRSKEYHWNGEQPPLVRISFSPARRLSRGGRDGLWFNLAQWMREGELNFPEYAALSRDPRIGSIRGPWQTIVKVIVAHELAHWVQYSSDVTKPPGRDYARPHGIGFQEIYGFLRAKVTR